MSYRVTRPYRRSNTAAIKGPGIFDTARAEARLLSWGALVGTLLVHAGWPSAAAARDTLDVLGDAMIVNLIQITAQFGSIGEPCTSADLTCKSESGFGFVVGEDDKYLYIATPDHIVSREVTRPGLPPSTTTSRETPARVLMQLNLPSQPVAVNLPASEVIVVDRGKGHVADVAFLRMAKPETWRSAFPLFPSSFDDLRAATVTYLGYKGRVAIPIDRGAVVDECQPAKSVSDAGVCHLWIEGLTSNFGTSGAPLLGGSFALLGMVISLERGEELLALRIDEIRNLAESNLVPWTVYSSEERAALGARLNDAITVGDLAEVETLLLKYIPLNNAYDTPMSEDFAEIHPIELATRKEHYEMVKTLIEHGAYGTPLAIYLAAKQGRKDVIQRYLHGGGDFSCALTAALRGKRPDIVDLLLTNREEAETLSLDKACYHETSPLYHSIQSGYVDIALELIDAGANVNNGWIDRVFIKGYPLTIAILQGRPELVNALLSHGAVPDAVEYPSRTVDATSLRRFDLFGPLYAAAYVGDLALVKRFVEQEGADPDVHRTTSQGKFVDGASPLEAAVLGGHAEVAEYLWSKGASPFGWRRPGKLLKDLRDSQSLPAAVRYELEIGLRHWGDAYCRALEQDRYEWAADYGLQRYHCDERSTGP